MKIEFFLDKTGTFLKVIYFKIDSQDWRKYDELTELEIEEIFRHLLKFEPARKGLFHLSRYLNGKREILRQFIHCNWTDLDTKLDISDKKLQFENIHCPFKQSNKCPFEGKGIVCVKY